MSDVLNCNKFLIIHTVLLNFYAEQGSRCDALEASLCSGGCLKLPNRGTPGRLMCRGDGIKDAELSLYIGVSGKIRRFFKLMDFELG